MTDDHRVGLTVTHKRYIPDAAQHYAGSLVDGAYLLGLCGDVATEVCIRTDGDEGLLASYADIQFLAPVRAGDVVEVTAEVARVGNRSRDLVFAAYVVCRRKAGGGRSDTGTDTDTDTENETETDTAGAEVLKPALAVLTARCTVVVPHER